MVTFFSDVSNGSKISVGRGATPQNEYQIYNFATFPKKVRSTIGCSLFSSEIEIISSIAKSPVSNV